MRDTAFLTISQLQVEPEIARRLPGAVARRFHAIPVAAEGIRLTVAMADPDDRQAREAVLAAAGLGACVVRGDRAAIDGLIKQVWPDDSRQTKRLRLLAYRPATKKRPPVTPKCPKEKAVIAYARALAELLTANLIILPEGASGIQAAAGEARRGKCDLLICGRRAVNLLKRLPVSLLVANRPRMPIRRILLLVKGQVVDQSALEWGIRLAKASQASVTVLAVIPPVPLMYQGIARLQARLPEILTTNTALGQGLRLAASRLAQERLDGVLRLRSGPPDLQVRAELRQVDYDLIVVQADSPDFFRRWWLDGLLKPLLRITDRPILVARPELNTQ